MRVRCTDVLGEALFFVDNLNGGGRGGMSIWYREAGCNESAPGAIREAGRRECVPERSWRIGKGFLRHPHVHFHDSEHCYRAAQRKLETFAKSGEILD